MAYNPEKAPNREVKPKERRPASPATIRKLGQTAVKGAK